MDKRYQVFVSSTFEDLQEERKEVMQALLELDCIPAGMELFPAANDDQWTLIKRVIDDSDYYILIIGGRYGSTNDEGKSYTQMEYEYALSTNKPIIAFLHKSPANIPSGKSEQDPENKKKLDEFKELAKKKLVKYWEGAENLGSVVSRSMINLIKNNPAEGWVKANSVVDTSSIAEISRLQKENEELQKQLKFIDTVAPKGSEEFAQGDDKINISFSFYGTEKNDQGIPKEYHYTTSQEFTWNELFSAVAPNLMAECDEKTVKHYFNNYIESAFVPIGNYKDIYNLNVFNIDQKSFNIIKIQFRALGLIQLDVDSDETIWRLTSYGDYMMTQIIAIKR